MCPLRYSSHPIMTQNSPVVKVTKLLGLCIQALMTVLSFSVSLAAQRKGRQTFRIMEPHRAQRKVQLVCFFSVYSLDSSDGPPQTSTDKTNFYVKIFLA